MAFETSAQVGLYRSAQVAQNEASENSINHYDKSVLYLSLIDGGEYNLVLSLSGGDNHSDTQLSFGTYTKAGKVLSLCDDLFGFVMQMEFVNDSCLKPINGLSIMRGQSFVFSGTTTLSSYRYDGAKDLLFENQENNSLAGFGLPTGKYRNRPSGRYELDLLRCGRYEYNIDGFLISRGRWKKDGQKLLFYDDEMLLPFSASLDKDGKKVFLAIGNPRLLSLSVLDTICQEGCNVLQTNESTKIRVHNEVAQCQLEGKEYDLDWKEDRLSCDILFINGSEYYIELSYYATDDIVYSLVLSYGNYITEGSLVKMTDAMFGYDLFMSFNDKTKSLEVKKGFVFMTNRCFNYHGKSYKNDVPIINPKDSEALYEERLKYVEEQKKLLPLTKGIYCSNPPFEYKLSIKEQEIYQLCYYDTILSKGQWERDGNILKLFDTSLDCAFYLLVGDGVFVSKLLPGDNTEGLVLKRKSANKPVSHLPNRGFGCSRNRNNQ